MKSNLTGQSNYARIYSLTDDTGKVWGTKQIIIAGAHVGTTYQSWSSKTSKEIKQLFTATEKA